MGTQKTVKVTEGSDPNCAHEWCIRAKERPMINLNFCTRCNATHVIHDTDMTDAQIKSKFGGK